MGKGMRALKARMYALVAELESEGRLRRRGSEEYDYEIEDTCWGDYVGSTYTRSNARRIAEDFAMLGVTETWHPSGYGARYAYLPASFANTVDWQEWPDAEERLQQFADAVRSLADYPVYDEDDLSAVEDEIVQESWDSWHGSDVHHEIVRAIGNLLPAGRTEDADTWQARAEDALYALEDSGDLRERFWELASEEDVYPEFETADSFYLRGQADICATIARELLDRTDARATCE